MSTHKHPTPCHGKQCLHPSATPDCLELSVLTKQHYWGHVFVPFCTVMVSLLATATAGLEMKHRTDREHGHSTGEQGEGGVSKIMTQKASKKHPIQAANKTCMPVFQSL